MMRRVSAALAPAAVARARRSVIVALLTLLPVTVGAQPHRPTPRASFAQLSAQAAAAREAGRADEAIALYRRAVAQRPSWDEGHWYLGTLLYEQERHREAAAAFAQVLQVHPSHAGAMAMSGLCAFAQGELEPALRALLRARQSNIASTPELAAVVRYHTAILLTRFSEFEAGNQVLVELAADAVDSQPTIDAFGVNLLRMPLLPSEVPADARPRVTLAGEVGVAVARRQTTRARQLAERLASEYPTLPQVHYLWGSVLLIDDPARALELFRKELAVSPQHVPARLQLAAELVKRGDAAAARPFAEEAVRIAPDQFATHLALGQVDLGLGDLPGATAALERAVKLAPGSAQGQYLLSVAYARAGRTAEAEQARQAFSRLDRTPGAAVPPP